MMKTRLTLLAVVGVVAVASMILQAATVPAWWVARGVISTNLPPDDFAEVNQGQLNWMALNAVIELESQIPGGAGSNLWALMESFSSTNNSRPVNLDQLKFVAKPFYDRLIEVGYTNSYPCTGQGSNDHALANIGQMKKVFSFDAAWWMTLDSDKDGIPDWWMFQNFGHVTGQSNDLSRATDDADGDGSSNSAECLAHTDPLDPNRMPADNPIKYALDSFNYSQVNLLRAVLGLSATRWTFQTNNATRITELQRNIEELIPFFLDTSVGGRARFKVHEGPKNWTLAHVLKAVGVTNGTWSTGLLEQVRELTLVLRQLRALPAIGVPMAQTDRTSFRFYRYDNVGLEFPPTWPVFTYVYFTGSCGDAPVSAYLMVNGIRYPLGATNQVTPMATSVPTNVVFPPVRQMPPASVQPTSSPSNLPLFIGAGTAVIVAIAVVAGVIWQGRRRKAE